MCDKSITPLDMAQLFVAKGYRTKNSGTKYAAMKFIANRYKGKGIKKYAAGKFKAAKLKQMLDAGALVICCMGPGYWTNSGHFIVAHKMDGTSTEKRTKS